MFGIKSRRKVVVPPLTCKAIFFCERVEFDEETGRLSLLRLFNEMVVTALPSSTQQFTVFLLFCDEIVGQSYELTWEIRDLTAGMAVYSTRGKTGHRLEWKDGRMRHDLYIVVPPQQIRHAGDYEIVVFVNNQEIGRESFTVLLAGASR
jgi:hypothetical protein